MCIYTSVYLYLYTTLDIPSQQLCHRARRPRQRPWLRKVVATLGGSESFRKYLWLCRALLCIFLYICLSYKESSRKKARLYLFFESMLHASGVRSNRQKNWQSIFESWASIFWYIYIYCFLSSLPPKWNGLYGSSCVAIHMAGSDHLADRGTVVMETSHLIPLYIFAHLPGDGC